MSLDLEEQYDRIYRYCYFKLHNRVLAEDITQEAFVRYLEHYRRLSGTAALKCLYTIARNLCADEFRKPKTQALETPPEEAPTEDALIRKLAVRAALSRLTEEEQELLLLRYVNEVPLAVLEKLYGLSRFALYRRLTSASGRFRKELRKEDYHG